MRDWGLTHYDRTKLFSIIADVNIFIWMKVVDIEIKGNQHYDKSVLKAVKYN